MPANNTKGFTLIEMVVGIIVFAVALVLFASVLVPQAKRSVEPIFQVRAAELAQSLINEITAKSFDENSDRVGGAFRCNDEGALLCTSSSNLGSEESNNRPTYDDVDDYHGLSTSGTGIKNSLDQEITLNGNALYSGFSVAVTVIYDDDMNGVDDAIDTGAPYIGNTKLITVTVTTPNDEDITFSSYRSNF